MPSDGRVSETLISLERRLAHELCQCDFSCSVDYVYNPLAYASDVHSKFIRKYCDGPKKLLFLGMNPGPWGMMQTGVPFGERAAVTEFLELSGTIEKPEREHPARPVLGFGCKRSEVSGKRFWELARVLGGGTPEGFFKHSYVYNYLPLGLLNSKGKNITPAELPAHIQKTIGILCDKALCDVISLLQVDTVVAIGRYAEKKALKVLRAWDTAGVKVVSISHPSPRNPASNKEWLSTTKQLIIEYNLSEYFCI